MNTKQFRVDEDSKLDLKNHPTDFTGDYKSKDEAVEDLEKSVEKIAAQVLVLEVHVAEIAYLRKTIHDHDRKIATLTEANRFQGVCKVRD